MAQARASKIQGYCCNLDFSI